MGNAIFTKHAHTSRSAILALSAALLASAGVSGARATPLPADAQMTCPAVNFNSWFQSGTPSLNGVVKPANSITFSNATDNCVFYNWSVQMFMWLASPAPSVYGGGDRIFDSGVFFDVSPPVNNQRHFVPHNPRFPRVFPLRIAKAGPHNLPVVMARSGRLLEVVEAPRARSGNSLIRNNLGQMVEVKGFKIGPGGKAVLTDAAGKPIATQFQLSRESVPQRALAPRILPRPGAPLNLQLENARIAGLVQNLNASPIVHKIQIDGRIIFFDLFGTPVPVEQGQATTDGVLISQNGSLVYYATIVNDVYAYMRTGQADGAVPLIGPSPGAFPVSQAQENPTIAFAAMHGKTFPDPEALTVEIKTSWVECSTVPDPQDFMTTMASVPTYNKSNNMLWTATGTNQTVKTCLTAIHVVGSTNGHPEMIWATFEHKNNAPEGTYTYNATSGTNPHTINTNPSGTWTFTANGSPGPYNTQLATFTDPNVAAATSSPIGPSNTLRVMAFGSLLNSAPNPLIPSAAASNTQVISMNNSVHGNMAAAGAAADVRNNYIFTGATWTINGAAPSSTPFPSGNWVGTSQLDNTTMETYVQAPNNTTSGSNCFSCHKTNTTGVSHVFGEITPLF
jgi:hypothetical protein